MISMKKKRALRSALAITICTVTIASVSTPVYSAPSTDELENTTSDLKGELNDLNSQLSSLSKELDTASSQVEDLAAKVEKSKLDLASAQLDEEAQYDSMKDRIKFMYEGGGASLVQILLTSENMGDFLNKAEYVATISKYDRSMLEELQQVRANVEKKQKDLEEQQSKLSGLQETLTSKRDELNSKISSNLILARLLIRQDVLRVEVHREAQPLRRGAQLFHMGLGQKVLHNGDFSHFSYTSQSFSAARMPSAAADRMPPA